MERQTEVVQNQIGRLIHTGTRNLEDAARLDRALTEAGDETINPVWEWLNGQRTTIDQIVGTLKYEHSLAFYPTGHWVNRLIFTPYPNQRAYREQCERSGERDWTLDLSDGERWIAIAHALDVPPEIVQAFCAQCGVEV